MRSSKGGNSERKQSTGGKEIEKVMTNEIEASESNDEVNEMQSKRTEHENQRDSMKNEEAFCVSYTAKPQNPNEDEMNEMEASL